MPVLLFAGLDAHRQPVLRRRQRARGVGCECAGWVVGLIEIEHDVAVVRHGRVEKAARAVSLLSARPIAEYIEKFLGIGGFQYWAEPGLSIASVWPSIFRIGICRGSATQLAVTLYSSFAG